MKMKTEVSGYGKLRSRLYIFLSIAVISFILPLSCFAEVRTVEGVVTYVSDGDTLWVRTIDGKELKIRLYGIDAPEIRHREKPGQPFGRQAAMGLRSKVRGRHVSIEVRDVDRYGRLVGVVRFNGRDINLEMVKEGWAWAYRTYLERPYASEYIEAEKKARAGKRGLWKQVNPQPPWEFRRLISDE